MCEQYNNNMWSPDVIYTPWGVFFRNTVDPRILLQSPTCPMQAQNIPIQAYNMPINQEHHIPTQAPNTAMQLQGNPWNSSTTIGNHLALETIQGNKPEGANNSAFNQAIANCPPTFAMGIDYPFNSDLAFEKAAANRRLGTFIYTPTCYWRGSLPKKTLNSAYYSSKVYIGDIPLDYPLYIMTEAFSRFGPVSIELPKARSSLCPRQIDHVFLLFENQNSVKALVDSCTWEGQEKRYYTIKIQGYPTLKVFVNPWPRKDSIFSFVDTFNVDEGLIVFVGAIHRCITAKALAIIMNDLFGGVISVGIDMDKYKYPNGSGRVKFNNRRSYMKAVTAALILIQLPSVDYTLQIDPHLVESQCSYCAQKIGPYFCKDLLCFKYYCRECWSLRHDEDYGNHWPIKIPQRNTNAN